MTSLPICCIVSYLCVYTRAISKQKRKRRRFHFLVVWVATQFWRDSLPVAMGFSCFVYMLCHLLLNKYCKCRLLFEFLGAKKPFPLVQCRRRRLALIMMMHLLDIHVRNVWIHPINNLRFENGEFFMLYCDLCKYEDCFFGWYRMSTKKFDELLGIVQNALRKKCTKFRELISSEEQLVITIT